jgi:UDP-glucose/iron transport system ATP-binding protein
VVPLFAFERVRVEGLLGPVLDDVSAVVPERGVTCIVGPSGAGKSTLLRLGNRLEVPTSGRVLFRGDDVAGLDPLTLRRRVGMVFQRPTLFGGTVRDNLRVGAPELEDDEAVELLARAELPAPFLDRPADDLSGGEAQRVCLARALAVGPEVLLLDEPTSALDERPRRALERLARGLAADGVPIVWVTPRLEQIGRLADWVLVLAGGRLRYAGSREGLSGSEDPDVVAFLAGGEDDE